MPAKIMQDKDYVALLERFINVRNRRVARLGFTESEILLIFRSTPLIKRFYTFMRGQTCGCDDKLGAIYYIHDTYRFIQSLHGVKSDYWD